MRQRRSNTLKNIDWLIVVLYLVLVFLGWINIYAAVYREEYEGTFHFSHRYGTQLLWIFISILTAIIIFLIDTKFYTFFSFPLYLISLLLLILVLVIGIKVNNARSWFLIGSFQIQPSEFAKIATALALAKYVSMISTNMLKFKSLLIAFMLITLPAGLIILQPDVGSTLVYFALIIVLYREGMPWGIMLLIASAVILFFASLLFDKIYIILSLAFIASIIFLIMQKRGKQFFYGLIIWASITGSSILLQTFLHLSFSLYTVIIFSMVISGFIMVIIAFRYNIRNIFIPLAFLVSSILFITSVDYIFHQVLKEHQQHRINVLLGFESDPQGIEYNVNQSKIAIGSGGFFGKGFLRGTQTKGGFVPEQSTDFIFCTIGEEWGFMGSSLIVLLFLIFLLRILHIAERQRSVFSRAYGYGVFSILSVHFIINIGMTIGIMPVIGIPLPFFSYGGSSLLAFTTLVFILLRLDASRTEVLV